MVLTNAERQARYRDKLKAAAQASYEADVQRKQIAALEAGLNEVRCAMGLSELQLVKSAHKPHR